MARTFGRLEISGCAWQSADAGRKLLQIPTLFSSHQLQLTTRRRPLTGSGQRTLLTTVLNDDGSSPKTEDIRNYGIEAGPPINIDGDVVMLGLHSHAAEVRDYQKAEKEPAPFGEVGTHLTELLPAGAWCPTFGDRPKKKVQWRESSPQRLATTLTKVNTVFHEAIWQLNAEGRLKM